METGIGVMRREEAEALWVLFDRVRFMGEVPGTGLAVVEVDVPPGSGTPPHRHASPEVFCVLEGEVAFLRMHDGVPSEVVGGPGTVVTVPSDVPHAYRNAGPTAARLHVVLERSMTAFFREVGRPEAPPPGPPNDADLDRVLGACARHGITMLTGATA